MRKFFSAKKSRYSAMFLAALLGTAGTVYIFAAILSALLGAYEGTTLDELQKKTQLVLQEIYSDEIYSRVVVDKEKDAAGMRSDNMDYCILQVTGQKDWEYLYKSPGCSGNPVLLPGISDFSCQIRYPDPEDEDEVWYIYDGNVDDIGLLSILVDKVGLADRDSVVLTNTDSTVQDIQNSDEGEVWILSRVKDTLDASADDYFVPMGQWVEFFYVNRYLFPVLGGLFLLVSGVLSVLCIWGRFRESREIRMRKTAASEPVFFWHRLPFVLFLAAFSCMIAVFIATLVMGMEALWDVARRGISLWLTGIVLSVFVLYYLLMAVCLEIACRTGLGNILDTILSYRLVMWFKHVARSARENIPMAVRALAALGGISFLELIVIGTSGSEFVIFAWFVFKVLEIPFMLKLFLDLGRLQKRSREMAEGDLDSRMDTSKMFWEFKKHGEYLNHISDGMEIAVGEQMKSERLRTELITNVSHDIKTPLTSIINYVDLLKKENIQGEKPREYLEVLERQSARLGKLIEDLLEASKASTGNVTMMPELCDVDILLTQVMGEFEERLKGKEIPLIIQKPGRPVYIMADNRHLFRVFDNLMSNIFKYGQQGTRAYINLEEKGQWVRIIFRNISQDPLNISSEELMERFVRGDASRNTEGSGLGLSIARDLTKLMGGQLELNIDGDLFKCVLQFPVTQGPAAGHETGTGTGS